MAGSYRSAWQQGIADEIRFWRELDVGHYHARLDFSRPLPSYVTDALAHTDAETIDILDACAGPLTRLTDCWPGRRVRLTAVDALSDAYDEILAEKQITPRVRTTWCHAELLHERFPPERFDLVHIRNALDHCYDPVAAIDSALAVVKTGSCVVLWHWANEAERGAYNGLHQWNLDCRDGRLVVWNREVIHDLSTLLAPRADVTVAEAEQARNQESAVKHRYFIGTIRKLKTGSR
jgi:SAM-dependent methyltransferase